MVSVAASESDPRHFSETAPIAREGEGGVVGEMSTTGHIHDIPFLSSDQVGSRTDVLIGAGRLLTSYIRQNVAGISADRKA